MSEDRMTVGGSADITGITCPEGQKYIRVEKKTFPTPYWKNDTMYAKGWNDCLRAVMLHPAYTSADILAGMWVPVTERLPKLFKSVLVSTITDDCTSLVRLTGFVDNYGAWYVHDSIKCSHLVTHWMPLPQPPKEG